MVVCYEPSTSPGMILLFRNLHEKFVSPSSLVTQRYRVTFVHLRALLMSFHSWKNMRNICRQWWMKKAIQGSMPLPKSLVKPWNVTEQTKIYEHVGSILDDVLFLFEYVLKSVGVCASYFFGGGDSVINLLHILSPVYSDAQMEGISEVRDKHGRRPKHWSPRGHLIERRGRVLKVWKRTSQKQMKMPIVSLIWRTATIG